MGDAGAQGERLKTGGEAFPSAWIESHQNLKDHPKTKRLARYLSITIRDAVGLLHFLWWWALDYADDGDLSRFEPEDLAEAVLWDGDAKLLVDSLVRAEFLDSGPELLIHDWHSYAGKLVERRKRNAERMKEARATHVQGTDETRVKLQYLTEPNQDQKQRHAAANDEPLETTPQERETLKVLKAIPGWPFDYRADLKHLRDLAVEYSMLDLLSQAKALSSWLLDQPLKKTSKPRHRFRNWCKKAEEFRQQDNGKSREPPSTNPHWDYDARQAYERMSDEEKAELDRRRKGARPE